VTQRQLIVGIRGDIASRIDCGYLSDQSLAAMCVVRLHRVHSLVKEINVCRGPYGETGHFMRSFTVHSGDADSRPRTPPTSLSDVAIGDSSVCHDCGGYEFFVNA
jgi:hypothetical protein